MSSLPEKIRTEEELIRRLAFMAKELRPQDDTIDFLEQILVALKRRELFIENIAGHVRLYVLQPITRASGKRQNAVSILVELLKHVGDSEANYFKSHINQFEESLRGEGRSFLEKNNVNS